ncbi:MAG: hypothetical protein FJW66_04345 [Actinobacteria bacterium]|nr:hypothetical protein [Actinomycetota bacterium]
MDREHKKTSNPEKSAEDFSVLKPCYIYISKSGSVLDEKIENIKKAVKSRLGTDVDFKIFYCGEEPDAGELSVFYNTPSFFSEKKVAVIKDFEKASLQLVETVSGLLENTDEDSFGTVLVITSQKDVEKKKTTKAMEKILSKASVKKLYAPVSDSLKKWLYEKAELDGIKFLPKASARFIENVNFDIGLLKREYEKIYTYIISEKDKAIDETAVNKLVARVLEMKIFDLVDFIGKRDKSGALVALKSVLVPVKSGAADNDSGSGDKRNILGLITLLHRMFKAFLYIKSTDDREILKNYILRNIGHAPYMVPKVTSNYIKFSANFNYSEIIKIIGILNRYDYLLRTAPSGQLKGLILKLIAEIAGVSSPCFH